MNGNPCFGPEPRSTDTRAKLSLAGLITLFVPSDRISVSSCTISALAEQVRSDRPVALKRIQHQWQQEFLVAVTRQC